MKTITGQIAVVSLTLILGSTVSTKLPQGTKRLEDLDSVIVHSNLNDTTATQTLAETLSRANLPGGIVRVLTCGADYKRSFKLRTANLHGLLDAIVAAEPDYSWDVNHGVINVFPRDESPFLEASVPTMKIREPSLESAFETVLAAPEIQGLARQYLGSRHVGGGVYAVSLNGNTPNVEANLSLNLEGLTVRGAFNEIVAASGKGVWLLTESQCSGQKTYSFEMLVK